MNFVTYSQESNQYIECKKCHIKFNKTIAKKCVICFPKKIKNKSPSQKRSDDRHWDKFKLHHQRGKLIEEKDKIVPTRKHNYFEKGKRTDFPL